MHRILVAHGVTKGLQPYIVTMDQLAILSIRVISTEET